MDFNFYQDPRYASSRPRSYGQSFKGIPAHVIPKAPPVQSSKPKMVSIPVQFVSSERSRSDSAIQIQKVFKGFLVRKNVKKITALLDQVNDIERNISKSETVDLIRNDSKERLKVNETLMSLLFKLDSVRGVDSCTRVLRKSVIKKAIALQELVDAIVSGDQSMDSGNGEAVDQSQGIFETSFDCNLIIQSENHDETTDNACDQTIQLDNHEETTENAEGVTNLSESEATVATNQENAVEEEANYVKERKLERIMKDNEKMMRMMETLFERNETQTRLLSELTRRVDLVEKANLCDKLRRKIKSQDIKKCCGGKR